MAAYAAASEAEEDAERREDDGEQDLEERAAPAGRHGWRISDRIRGIRSERDLSYLLLLVVVLLLLPLYVAGFFTF